MYLKYVTNNQVDQGLNGTSQIAWEISEILMGNITDMSTLTYGTATVAGTLPTAGTYTRVTPTSNGSHYACLLKKKHCQYDAGTFPAEMHLSVFNSSGHYNTLAISDKDNANTGFQYYPHDSSTADWSYPYSVGSKFHFIINDTTFLMYMEQPDAADPNSMIYNTVFWSDFEKTSYDTYAIGQNAKYYPGGAYAGSAYGPSTAYYNNSSFNFISAYRFQYQKANDGAFANSTVENNYVSNETYWGWSANVASASHTFNPSPAKRIFKTWGPSGHSIVMAPMMYNGQRAMSDNYSWANTNTEVGYRDARYHSPMLNSYRITDSTGFAGDIIQTSDNTQYYIFPGHRVGTGTTNNTATSTYHQSCYAFPKDNVPIS